MMRNEGDEVHVDETEASGGSKEGVVRWVLIIGTVLAIGLLSIIWITGAVFQGDVEEEATVSGRLDSQIEEENDQTDSIVSENAAEIDEAPDPNEPEVDPRRTIEN